MADLGDNAVFSEIDDSNNGVVQPFWRGNQAANLIDESGRALQGAMTRAWVRDHPTVTTTGSAGAYTATYGVQYAAYYNALSFEVIANHANPGASTFREGTMAATAIKKVVGGALVDLAAGDIPSLHRAKLSYHLTSGFFVLHNPFIQLAALATTTDILTGTDNAKTVTPDSVAALWEQGADVASATAVTLGEGGYFNVTGGVTITDIDFAVDKAGRPARLRFAAALTLTHSATLILPGAANIITAAGDVAEFVSEGSDIVRCVSYTRATGLATVITPYWDFTSADITPVAGSNTYATVAHGLGAAPSRVAMIARCTTAEHTFAVGDLIEIPTTAGSYDGSNSAGMTISWNATNILVTQFQQNAGSWARVGHAAAGGSARNLTATSWVFTLRAKR